MNTPAILASNDCLSSLANLSTIVACLVAIAALIFGGYQFYWTQQSTRESQAVELFTKFNQLNIDQGQGDSKSSDHWYNICKFSITESLFEISKHSDSWRSTVKWMLEQQRDFILAGGFEVESYSVEFRNFCKDNGFELKQPLNRQ